MRMYIHWCKQNLVPYSNGVAFKNKWEAKEATVILKFRALINTKNIEIKLHVYYILDALTLLAIVPTCTRSNLLCLLKTDKNINNCCLLT